MVPGCGPRLLLSSHDSHPKQLGPIKRTKQKPKYTNYCYEMSTDDHYLNMNIFTVFGDLSPSQMLTLFNTFVNWPEYKECIFLTSMENALLKLETSMDLNTRDQLDIHDDIDNPIGTEVELDDNKKIF